MNNKMPPFTMFTTPGAQRVGAAWRTAAAQPSWMSRAVLLTFILVIGIPIFLLVSVALIAASLVFSVLWGFNYLMIKVKGALPHNDGREGVKVIRRKDV